MMVGLAALSIDVGFLLVAQAQLQGAADAAALAAASSLDDEDNATSLAAQYAESNMPEDTYGAVLESSDVVFGNWDTDADTFTADETPTNAVKVTLRMADANNNPVTLYFAQLAGIATSDVSVQAIASESSGDGNFCFFATDEDDKAAFKISGTAEINLGECGIAVASSDDKGFDASGTVDVSAGSICVAGGADDSSNGTIDPEPEEDCDDIPSDPLASLAEPTPADECDETDYDISGSDGSYTLSPGTYCGGIQISGSDNEVVFEPGVYILAGGGMKVTGGGNTLTNETDSGIGGVIFFNTESEDGEDDFADVSFAGGSDVTLSAPTSGTYEGVLFFQDTDSADANVEFSVAGNAEMSLDGVIYFPDHQIDFSGNSTMAMSCMKLIGNVIEFSGTSGTDLPDSCVSDAVSISSDTNIRLRG